MPGRILALAIVVLLLPGLAVAAQRVALVVGVAHYDNANDLDNPSRDASAVATALRAAGFEVQLTLDPDQEQFGQELLTFARKSKGAEAALFYFAGHGIQINAKNYLLTRSAKVSNPLLIDQDGFELGKILDLIAQNANTTIAMIDACRDNPLAQALVANTEPATRSAWGLSRGLAPLDREYSNSLVAFATSPGRVAYDGAETHSPFTNALLKHIATPGIEVSVLLKRITREVLVATDGAQRPEVVASMAREFYFYKPVINVEGDVVLPPQASPEAIAAELLRLAMDLPPGAERDASVALIAQRFEGTAAAEIARHMASAEKAGTAATTRSETAPAEPQVQQNPPAQTQNQFDSAVLDGLDIAALREAARQKLAENAPPTPESVEAAMGLQRDDIVKVQRALNVLGHDPGGADGTLGPQSRRALRSFQVAARIPQSGYLDRKTIDALLKAVAEAPLSYEGNWQLIVYREWLRQDRNYAPNVKGKREILVSAQLVAREGRFDITNYNYRTVMPDRPFEDFEARYTDSGRVTMTGRISSMFRDAKHVVAQLDRMSVSFQLPEVVPFSKGVEAGANAFERDLKFHVSLTRLR
ncbi:MAG: caspase family protein [Roseivivax sp.]|nr:caspase family protein [Roseivivax sp.]